MIPLVLLIVALVLFAVAALGVSSRINLMAAELFFWLLSSLIGRIH